MELRRKFQELLKCNFDLDHAVLFEQQQRRFFDRLYSNYITVFNKQPDAGWDFYNNDYAFGIIAELCDPQKPSIALEFVGKEPFYDEDGELDTYKICFFHRVEINLSNEAGDFAKMLKRLIEVAQNELENIPTKL